MPMRVADTHTAGSLANRLRARRLELFSQLIEPLAKPVRIADMGGTTRFWEMMGWTGRSDIHITLLNLYPQPQRYANIVTVAGDGCHLPQFGDRAFDVVFSNSVIEHLFTFENQRRMAGEIQRIGGAYFVQTPNYYFPFEPHFHFLGWQYLPVAVRVFMLRRFRCGWYSPIADAEIARLKVTEIRLLSRGDLGRLFPGATLLPERFLGLTKSWTALRGFPGLGLAGRL